MELVKKKWVKKNNNKQEANSADKASEEVVSGRGSSRPVLTDSKAARPSNGSNLLDTAGCYKDPNVSEGNTSSCCEHSDICKRGPEKRKCECFSTEDQQEGTSHRHLSQCTCSETVNIMPYKHQDRNASFRKSTISDCQNSGVLQVRSVMVKSKFNNLSSKNDSMNETTKPPHFNKGKENIHLLWRKSQRNFREAGVNGLKRSNSCSVDQKLNCLQKKFPGKYNTFSGVGLLPSPLISSYRHKNGAFGIKTVANRDSVMFKGVYSNVFVDSFECASQFLSQSTQNTRHHSSISENNCNRKRGQPGFRDHLLSFQCRHVSHQNGLCSLQPFPAFLTHQHQYQQHLTGFSEPVQVGFKPCYGLKMQSTRTFHPGFDSRTFSGNKLHSSGRTAKKWVPVGIKLRTTEKTISAGSCNAVNGNLQVPCKQVGSGHSKGEEIPFKGPVTLTDSSTISSTSHHETSLESKPPIETVGAAIEAQNSARNEDCNLRSQKPNNIDQLKICSQVVEEALNNAYGLQLASEHIEMKRGSPLANVERLLISAAPVILPSINPKCSLCLDKQRSSIFLCKHQVSNIPLSAVWDWYEKPGSYGLEVKVEDPQKRMALRSQMNMFHAYFFPSLSAIQLFGYQQDIKLQFSRYAKFPSHSLEELERNYPWPEDLSLIENSNLCEPIFPSHVGPYDGSDSQGSFSSTMLSGDSEVLFEFFESSQPHERRPIHDKIQDLIHAGTSNTQVFGDPLKLASLNLRDLHPASWFSVAWYPIYGIPDETFRTAFLTYHSLGHLVRRRIPNYLINKNLCCVVAPVVGLISYNPKGERWFYPKMQPVSLESSPFINFETLSEQLKTLENNASIFAGGCVRKDNVKVINQQSDYKFFMSKKLVGLSVM